MISFLRGQVFAVRAGAIDLDVHGVGYRILIPARWSEQLSVGDDLLVYTHHAVREDAIQLYGFETESDRDWFEMLLAVSGIGPKGALQLLSATTAADFAAAVADEDTAALCSLPGVGKKTAQRLVVELRDKVDQLWYGGSGQRRRAGLAGPADVEPLAGVERDVVEALIALGYNERQAVDRAREVLTEEPGLALEEALRRCLQRLAK